MAVSSRRIVAAALLILFAIVIAGAATRRYQELEDAFRKECQAQRQKLGLSAGDLRVKYPTPEVHLTSTACIMPGATADAVASGRWAQGARFFVENDNIQVVKESAAGNQYRATLKVAAGTGPETAAIAVMQPMTGQMVRADNAVRVGGRYEFTLTAGNGWKIVARPQSTDPCGPSSPDNTYDVSFFRGAETTPFEKMTGTLHFSQFGNRNYNFSLQSTSSGPAGMESYQDLMRKLGDPKLTDAQRQQVMKDLEQASKQMQAAMQKMSDPSYVKQQAAQQQRREQEFGCRTLDLSVEAGRATGEMRCSEKVGTRLPVNGTVGLMK